MQEEEVPKSFARIWTGGAVPPSSSCVFQLFSPAQKSLLFGKTEDVQSFKPLACPFTPSFSDGATGQLGNETKTKKKRTRRRKENEKNKKRNWRKLKDTQKEKENQVGAERN